MAHVRKISKLSQARAELALHHLTSAWNAIALLSTTDYNSIRNLGKTLKASRELYMFDGHFGVTISDMQTLLETVLSNQKGE